MRMRTWHTVRYTILSDTVVCAKVAGRRSCIAHAQYFKYYLTGKIEAMASYEPQRTSAYSDDLRWRMVWQCEALGLKYSDVASNLGVDSATARVHNKRREYRTLYMVRVICVRRVT